MRVVSEVIKTEGVLLKQGFLGTFLLKNGMGHKGEELQLWLNVTFTTFLWAKGEVVLQQQQGSWGLPGTRVLLVLDDSRLYSLAPCMSFIFLKPLPSPALPDHGPELTS